MRCEYEGPACFQRNESGGGFPFITRNSLLCEFRFKRNMSRLLALAYAKEDAYFANPRSISAARNSAYCFSRSRLVSLLSM